MSFRTRLGLFFLLIVVIPIALIAVLVVRVTSDSREGKADAQMSTALEAALSVHEDAVAQATRAGQDVVSSDALADALADGDTDRIRSAAADAAAEEGVVYLQIQPTQGNALTPVRTQAPIATAVINTTGDGGDFEITVSTLAADDFVSQVGELTDLDIAVTGVDGNVVASNGAAGDDIPAPGDVVNITVGEEERRAASARLDNTGVSRVTVFAPLDSVGILGSGSRIAIVVAAFLALALLGVLFMARILQTQVAQMLGAAKRIGSGDFSQRVPVVGRDEMAGLASEFNKMSDQLEGQIHQLQRQRNELDRSVQRLGEAFASGLDRDALLAIVAETALGACQAEYARVSIQDGHVIEVPGDFRGESRVAAIAGQERADSTHERVVARRGDGHALAAPLRRLSQPGSVGSLTISRARQSFDSSERNVFLYLLGQASASLENITAHEEVTVRAVTDELTGLANNRSFRETIDEEASRAERFDHELSLVILDVDNFKGVNDTYGHQQGDEVLKMLGSLLLEEPRAIDKPARYGGEEFVVALPETGMDGAVELAERIREKLEGTEMPLLDGSGVLKVTASFGAATIPGSARTVRALFAAADEALYEAKRTGKNRVVTAPETVRTPG